MFYSLSVVISFENSRGKFASYSYIHFAYRIGPAPLGHQDTPLLELLVDSLLQHTGKRHQAAIAPSGNIVMGWGTLLRDAGNPTCCGKLHMTFEGSHTEKQWPP